LTGSELDKLQGRLATSLAEVDLAVQAEALASLRDAVREGGLPTVHDVAEGGVAVTLAECCIEGGLGAQVDGLEPVAEALFGEGPGGVVIAGPAEVVEAVSGARVIGTVGGAALEIEGALSLPVGELRAAYEGSIPAAFA
jgi:phosphoribosylformylglycinamidine synthase